MAVHLYLGACDPAGGVLHAVLRPDGTLERREWLADVFAAGFADDLETAQEIRERFEQDRCLVDTHTAVASRVLREYRRRTGDATPAVIVSTASPYKFAGDVLASLLGAEAVEGLDAFACAEQLRTHTGVPIPRQIEELKTLPVRHQAVCERDGMEQALFAELRKA